MLQKQMQQRVFLKGELHRHAVGLDGAGYIVDDDAAELQRLGRRGRGGCRGAAQHGFDPGNKLHNAEGLAEVIVRAVVQPLDDVDLAGFGRDHDDRRCGAGRVGAQLSQNLVAVLVGQHDVQNDEVGPPAAQRRPEAGRVLVARGLVPVGL